MKRAGVSMSARLLAAWLACALTTAAAAHELPANRVTLVLRDDRHLSLTCFIDYTTALHRALAPQRALHDFVLQYAAMKPAEFQKELLKAQQKFKAGTTLALPTGEPLTLRHWRWPEASHAQQLLQQRAMQSVVGGAEHAHEMPFEVHAEVASPRAIASVVARLPDEFGKLLVVSYRPRQVWVAPHAPTSIRF